MDYIECFRERYFVQCGEASDLSSECQQAIKIYNANVDGKCNGLRNRYILMQVPALELEKFLMRVEPLSRFGSFSAYHEYYKKTASLKRYDRILPIVLDSVFGCVIEDGWKRFHSYVEQGVMVIPCLLQIGV